MSANTQTQPQSQWHQAVLWFLGSIALVALASPAPNIATWLVIALIVAVLLNNWPVYASVLGMK